MAIEIVAFIALLVAFGLFALYLVFIVRMRHTLDKSKKPKVETLLGVGYPEDPRDMEKKDVL